MQPQKAPPQPAYWRRPSVLASAQVGLALFLASVTYGYAKRKRNRRKGANDENNRPGFSYVPHPCQMGSTHLGPHLFTSRSTSIPDPERQSRA